MTSKEFNQSFKKIHATRFNMWSITVGKKKKFDFDRILPKNLTVAEMFQFPAKSRSVQAKLSTCIEINFKQGLRIDGKILHTGPG